MNNSDSQGFEDQTSTSISKVGSTKKCKCKHILVVDSSAYGALTLHYCLDGIRKGQFGAEFKDMDLRIDVVRRCYFEKYLIFRPLMELKPWR
jgi:hypothetical protein